ncbi:UmoD family flagellar biogenesis regulator [Xenorhabdus cabanillasii]|uniref:UmoD n=2 Tax=Xenorhabdus cabanillasii TaxID=351673 RepID=A0A3D9UEC1_9GAMM|nr:UmoD family flagellar biogenesis regulator [Xenorhabdus cabanillasii]PHM78409.1 UmoD [Xenorhabdus cabanillasii JM26]REF27832.1 hypothetical protein BDD26_2654 [Xenorhabdus cabanillasii]CDL87762.1 putative UmoD [Xenorhabdus cabanillasii JM26]
MSKLKTRQCGIYSLIVMIAVGIAAIFYFKNPQPKIAQVLSSEPIKTMASAPQYYCNGALLPFLIGLRNIENDHLSVYKNSMFTLIEMLNIKREYHALNYSQLKNCVMVHVKEKRIIGYDVIYMIGDKPGKVRVTHRPEQTIPLDEKGRLILKPYL